MKKIFYIMLLLLELGIMLAGLSGCMAYKAVRLIEAEAQSGEAP